MSAKSETKTETEQPQQSGLHKDVQEILETDLSCAICQDIYINPLILNCSHSFCKFCIYRWLVKKTGCPQCRIDVEFQAENLAIRNIVNKMILKTSAIFQVTRDNAVKQRLKDEDEQEKEGTTMLIPKTPNVGQASGDYARTMTGVMRLRHGNANRSNGDSSASSSSSSSSYDMPISPVTDTDEELSVAESDHIIHFTTDEEDDDDYDAEADEIDQSDEEAERDTFEVEIISSDSDDEESMDNGVEWLNDLSRIHGSPSNWTGESADEDDDIYEYIREDNGVRNFSYAESSDSTNTSDDDDDDDEMNSGPSRYSEQSTIEYGTSDDSD